MYKFLYVIFFFYVYHFLFWICKSYVAWSAYQGFKSTICVSWHNKGMQLCTAKSRGLDNQVTLVSIQSCGVLEWYVQNMPPSHWQHCALYQEPAVSQLSSSKCVCKFPVHWLLKVRKSPTFHHIPLPYCKADIAIGLGNEYPSQFQGGTSLHIPGNWRSKWYHACVNGAIRRCFTITQLSYKGGAQVIHL